MSRPDLLSTVEAARIKGCTRQGIHAAIQRGKLNTYAVGRHRHVVADATFEAWQVADTGGRAHASYRQDEGGAQDEREGA